MSEFHRHPEVEFNLVEQGRATYLYGGRLVRIEPGRLVLFWATVPHQTIEMTANARLFWLYLPLAWFIRCDLPAGFRSRIMEGEMVAEPDPGRAGLDSAMLSAWEADLGSGNPERMRAMVLELEARLRRLALAVRPGAVRGRAAPRAQNPGRSPSLARVERMARYISEHYAEPLHVPEVARAAGLHPNYAVGLFRRMTGTGIVNCINQHRIAHAQRLLATTRGRILQIALESGFGSLANFNASFRRSCGVSPSVFRKSVLQPSRP
jgi:AraC-like DNA-binding protein